MQEISLVPDTIFSILGFSFNNAVLGSFIVTAILAYITIITSKKLTIVPGNLQIAMESTVSIFYTKLFETYNNKDLAKKHAALIVSLFLFVFISNQFSLIPLVQSLTSNGFIVFKMSPLKHIGNYIKIKSIIDIRSPKDIGTAFLDVFLGMLDIVGELAKIISLSCRLFGNIFAGEVMIAVISGMSIYTSFIVPIPFYLISIFSGIIQALVFAYLATSFISGVAVSSKANLFILK